MSKTVNPVSEKQTQPVAEKPVERSNQVIKPQFLFSKDNYMLMFAGLGVIILGFILMAGGRSADPNVFDYDAIYSARRITIAPILVLLGLAIEGYAIMKRPATTA